MRPEDINQGDEEMEDAAEEMGEEQLESDPSSEQLGWPMSLMRQSWNADQGEDIDRNTSDFRQLRSVKTSLHAWISQHGGIHNPKLWDNMEKVTFDGKVRKRLIYPGSSTAPITEGMFVAWQYTGFIEPNFDHVIDATRFSGRREVFRVDKVGDNDMIQRGLRLGVSTMHLGETAHFRIHPDYAFGRLGVPPRIPPNAVLHYVIEIRDEEVDDRKASNKFLRQQVDILDLLGFDTCYKAACEFRERGITAFRKSAFELARENFEDGIRAVEVCQRLMDKEGDKVTDLEQAEQVTDIGHKLRMNAAVSNAKLSNWNQVADLTTSLVDGDENDTKALYYLALADFHLSKFEEALTFAEKGIRLRPACPELAELYAKLVKRRETDQEKEKMFCKRMFPAAQSAVKLDRWALIRDEVRQHVAQEIAKLQANSNIVDLPLNYAFFSDKLNLSYAEEQAKQVGFVVTVREGKMRNLVRLSRTA